MSKKDFEFTGIREVMDELNKELEGIKGRSLAGMIHAAIHVRRSMAHRPPLIPVDTGNLNASFSIVSTKGSGTTESGGSPTFKGKDASKMQSEHASTISTMKATVHSVSHGPAVLMGFSANYAGFVHENMEAKFLRPGSGPKFFEAHLRSESGEILNIIRDHAKIK